MEKFLELREKIEALKEELTYLRSEDPKLSNQFYLAHWLHSQKYDVKKAAEAVRANRKWRRANNIDRMATEEPPESFRCKFPFFLDVRGKNDRPVVYYQGALVDIPSLIKEFGRSETLLHMAHFMVKVEEAVYDWENRSIEKADDELVAQRMNNLAQECGAFYIIDAEHITLKKATSPQIIKFFIDWSWMGAQYFPNACHLVHVINTSRFIPLQLANPIIRPRGIALAVYPKDAGEEELGRLFSGIQEKQLQELQARAKALCKFMEQ